jgi:hypothetical protein
MNTNSGLNRHTLFALMASLAAGLVSFLLITFFIDMLNVLFIPTVMVVVFFAARSAFRRQMKGHIVLTGKKIFTIALEVGTLTHFYAFSLYLPLVFLVEDGTGLSAELIGGYLLITFIGGIASLVMFVWIAVPMYIGIGHLVRVILGEENNERKTLNDSLLDDGFLSSDLDAIN